jgi:hypothetical protein
MVILVDSGSSHSFVDLSLAQLLSGVSPTLRPVQVQVANGQIIKCDIELKQACWSIQNLNFVIGLKFLPLPYYGMILGIDWLEVHSTMKVEWLNKWIVINFQGTSVQLQGLQPSLPEHSVIECVRTTSEMRGLSSKIISGDS